MKERRPELFAFLQISPSLRTSGLRRSFRALRQNAFDFFQVAANDGRVNAVALNLRVSLQDAQCGPRAASVRGWTICQDWISAGIFQKRIDQLRVVSFGGRPIRDFVFHRR
jgi:hypothetical protein